MSSNDLRDTGYIVGTVLTTYSHTYTELRGHHEELSSLKIELSSLHNTVEILQQEINSSLTQLEDDLKRYIKENVATKSELDSMSRKIIDWVNENAATKADILKSENTLFWKIAGFIAAIVALTGYILKG